MSVQFSPEAAPHNQCDPGTSTCSSSSRRRVEISCARTSPGPYQRPPFCQAPEILPVSCPRVCLQTLTTMSSQAVLSAGRVRGMRRPHPNFHQTSRNTPPQRSNKHVWYLQKNQSVKETANTVKLSKKGAKWYHLQRSHTHTSSLSPATSLGFLFSASLTSCIRDTTHGMFAMLIMLALFRTVALVCRQERLQNGTSPSLTIPKKSC